MSIKKIIERTGMKRTDVSKYLNIPYRTIDNWCNEKSQCPKYIEDLIDFRLNQDIIQREGFSLEEINDIKFCIEFSNSENVYYYKTLKEAKEDYENEVNITEIENINRTVFLEMVFINDEKDVIHTIYLDKA